MMCQLLLNAVSPLGEGLKIFLHVPGWLSSSLFTTSIGDPLSLSSFEASSWISSSPCTTTWSSSSPALGAPIICAVCFFFSAAGGYRKYNQFHAAIDDFCNQLARGDRTATEKSVHRPDTDDTQILFRELRLIFADYFTKSADIGGITVCRLHPSVFHLCPICGVLN